MMAAGDKNEALATKPATATTRRNTKKEAINRSKLGPDYIAPDGGHGWFVALAAGCSNVSTIISIVGFELESFIQRSLIIICLVNDV